MQLNYTEKYGSVVYVDLMNVPSEMSREEIIEEARDYVGAHETLTVESLEWIDSHRVSVRFTL